MEPTNQVVRLADYKPHPRNYNHHPEPQIKRIQASLRKFGQVRSVVVWRGQFLAGNGVAEAARGLGWETIRADVLPDDYPEHLALAYVAADNELARQGDPDQAQLAAIIEESAAADAELLEAIGYSEKEFNDLLKSVGGGGAGVADVEPQIDKAEELRQKWGVELGQMWQLGDHRLICGDCTDAAGVAQVMEGEKARAVVTSPPYSDQREYKLGSFNWLALMNGCTDALFSVCGNPADVVINLGMSHVDGKVDFYWNDWLSHCEHLGYPLFGMYVWDKGSGFPGEWNGRLAPAHEFIFHFSIGRQSANKWIETSGESAKRGSSGKRFRQKDGSLAELTSPDSIGQPYKVPDSVIRIGREMARGIHTESHPAVFPPEFAEFLIRTWTDNRAIVYEPFSGSGTTIIACEQLGRRCRAVEISPGYVAVALQRWADATGKTPKLVTDG